MRTSVRLMVSVVVLIVGGLVGPAGAFFQLPWNMGMDASMRMEYLFGSQSISESGLTPLQAGSLKFMLDPRLPVVSGTVELSPGGFFSGRLGGCVSISSTGGSINRAPGFFVSAPSTADWDTETNFSSWEAAALGHIFNGGGYRFSVTAGYRQDRWRYTGEPVGPSTGNTSSDDVLTSHIPFLGLQTSMVFPWWKARFEVLGSPFMNRTISGSRVQGGTLIDWDGKAASGGLIEVDVEGTVHVTTNVLVGLHWRYTHQELYGKARQRVNGGATVYDYDIHLNEDLATVGLNATLFY